MKKYFVNNYLHLLEKELIGRHFIYTSPYGGIVKGIVEKICMLQEIFWDKDKSYNIISTNGIAYHYDEIHLENA